MRVNVCSDVFDIGDRLKGIDGGYYIVYDTAKKAYEVHNSNQYNDSYCLTLPYGSLDARAVEYVRKTAAANRDKLIAEIEAHNQKLESGRA